MRLKRQSLALVAGLLLVGCGVTVQAPPTGGGGGTLVEAPMSPEAEREFRMLDVDPDRDVLIRIANELNLTVVVNQETTVVNGEATPTVVLPTNAEQVSGVSQKEENHQAPCATWTPVASSTRNDYFRVANTHDANLRTAWAPAESDAAPSLTFTPTAPTDVSAMTIKMSPQGVVVDIDVMRNGEWTRLVTGLVPEYRTLDWINVPTTRAEQVRLSFRGAQANQALVCHVAFFGPDCAKPASPAATTAPTVQPTTSPAATTSPTPSPSATAEPVESPSAEVTATPTAEPTATPTAEPTATVEPTPTPDASASPAPLQPTT
jgi:hypothetical protein